MAAEDPSRSLRRPALAASFPAAAGTPLEAAFLKSVFAEISGSGRALAGDEADEATPALASTTGRAP